jgi:hypothetical protein
MSAALTPEVIVLLNITAGTALPAANAAYASTLITLTDASSKVQTASVNGTESPAWTATFTGVAVGAFTLSAQAKDANGANIGAAATGSYTETGTPATYPAPASFTVTYGGPNISSAPVSSDTPAAL